MLNPLSAPPQSAINALNMLVKFHFITSLLAVFFFLIRDGCWVLCFFCVYEDDPFGFLFHSVNSVKHIDLQMLTLHSWGKLHLVMLYYPFCSVGFNLLKNVLKEFSYLCPQVILVFFFSCNVFVKFQCQNSAILIE